MHCDMAQFFNKLKLIFPFWIKSGLMIGMWTIVSSVTPPKLPPFITTSYVLYNK